MDRTLIDLGIFYETAGTVAAFTAGIVMIVGQQPTTQSVDKLALGRIEANFLGILVIFAIGFLWPLRSANSLRRSVIPSIVKKIRYDGDESPLICLHD